MFASDQLVFVDVNSTDQDEILSKFWRRDGAFAGIPTASSESLLEDGLFYNHKRTYRPDSQPWHTKLSQPHDCWGEQHWH